MFETHTFRSIASIDANAWNACFVGDPETHEYLRAVEEAGLPGFDWRYFVVTVDGRILAAAPGFITIYPLDTTLGAAAKKAIASLRRAFPGLLAVRLAAIGSPCTETAAIGFRSEVDDDARSKLLKLLMGAFERDAHASRCSLLAIKDVPTERRNLCETVVRPMGYRAIPGLPSAHLDIDFADIDGYLARLSSGTRRDMRRKLKTLNRVNVDVRHDLNGYEETVMALYRDTRARAEMSLEDLTSSYFTGVLERMGQNAFCVLYSVNGETLAANLVLQRGDTLLDKFFVMNAARGREHNLYYLSWFTNLRLCLERGLTRYECGQAGYANKIKLASTLTPNSLYFRHANAFINGVLQIVAPILSMGDIAEADAP